MSRFKIKKCPRGGGRQRRQIAFRKSEPATFQVTTFRCADFPFEKQELGSSGERSAEESFTRCDPLKLGGFRYACEQGTNESVRLAVPATRLVGIDPDRFLFFGGDLAQLNEQGGAVTTGRSMRRAVRAAQLPASRRLGCVFRKGTAQHQDLFSAGVGVLRKHRIRGIPDKAGCAGLLAANAIKHDALHTGLRGGHPAVVIRSNDGSL